MHRLMEQAVMKGGNLLIGSEERFNARCKVNKPGALRSLRTAVLPAAFAATFCAFAFFYICPQIVVPFPNMPPHTSPPTLMPSNRPFVLHLMSVLAGERQTAERCCPLWQPHTQRVALMVVGLK